jgi:hypothetical protein
VGEEKYRVILSIAAGDEKKTHTYSSEASKAK